MDHILHHLIIAFTGASFAVVLLCALILKRGGFYALSEEKKKPTRIQRMFSVTILMAAISFIPFYINEYVLDEPNDVLMRWVNSLCVAFFGLIPIQAIALLQRKIRWYYWLVIFWPTLLLLVASPFVTGDLIFAYGCFDLFAAIYIFGFVFYALYGLRRWDMNLMEVYSDIVYKQTAWFRRLVWPMFTIPFMWVVMAIFPDSEWLMLVYYVIQMEVILRFTANAFTQEEFELKEEPNSEFLAMPEPIHKEASKPKEKREQEVPSWASALEKLMVEDCVYRNDDLSRNDVAEMLNINRTYLSDYVNNVCHMTFYDYVNSFRLEEAKKLLSEGKKNITEIALQCGFKDNRAFYRVFRKEMGVSPTQWAQNS